MFYRESVGFSRTFLASVIACLLISALLNLKVCGREELLQPREALLFTQLQIALYVRAASVWTNLKLIRNVTELVEVCSN